MVDILFQLTSDLHSPTPTFTLTCVSNGGPVTYANWTRDGIPVPQNRYHLTSHSLVNAQVATYHSTLSITGRLPGLYRCEVTSVRPDRTVTDAQGLDIVGELVLYYDTWQQILVQPLHHHQLIYICRCLPSYQRLCTASWSHQYQSLLDCTNLRSHCDWVQDVLPGSWGSRQCGY